MLRDLSSKSSTVYVGIAKRDSQGQILSLAEDDKEEILSCTMCKYIEISFSIGHHQDGRLIQVPPILLDIAKHFRMDMYRHILVIVWDI